MAKETKPTPTPKVAQAAKATPAPAAVAPGGWAIPIPDGADFGGGCPVGTYISRCSEEPTESISSKGDPQTEFTFEVCDPAFPDLNEKTGKLWCSRKPKAWWTICGVLDGLGVPYEIDKVNKLFKFDPMACVGQLCKTVWEENTHPTTKRVSIRINRVIGVNESVETAGGDVSGGGEGFEE